MSKARLTDRDGFTHRIGVDSGHTITFDEPESAGGTNHGASPTDMLGASLAACIAMTMRSYAKIKEWELEDLGVEVETTYDGPRPSAFSVSLTMPENLDPEQQRRLRIIAGKCPVHRSLSDSMPIDIT